MKKKITFTALHLRHGGVELALSQQANALVERGYEVEILCSYHLGDPAYPLDPRVKLRYLTDRSPNRASFWEAWKQHRYLRVLSEGAKALKTLYLKRKTMREAIRSVHGGVLVSTRHEHSCDLSAWGQPGVQKVAQLHHDHRFDPKLLHDFLCHYQNLDDFVLLLPDLQEEMQAHLGQRLPRLRIHSIGNFLPGTCPRWQGEEKEKVLVWVGRMSPEKGGLRLFDLLEAWEALPGGALPDGYRLLLLGDGPEREAMERRLVGQPWASRVEFRGMCSHEEVLSCLRRAQALLLTSHTEGFAMVLLEAVASGAVPFAYDVRMSPRRLIAHGRSGYLIPDGDARAYALALSQFVKEAERLQPLLAQEGFRLLERYSEETVMGQWEALYAMGPVKRGEKDAQ